MRGISFVKGKPAMKIGSTLVVSDLHIGLEFKFSGSGVYFPNASRKMANEILEICKASKASDLVILGDVKESIGNVTRDEENALREFFETLKGVRIRIAKGNHDAYLDRILKKLGFDVPVEKEIFLGNAALMHGNFMPSSEAMKKRYLVMGHGHMAAYVNGELEKVWFIAGIGKGAGRSYSECNAAAKLIIVPAFNSMITGSGFSTESKRHMPLLRNEVFAAERAEVRTLSGLRL
ncbi:MAG: metallophosphoesterase family protein [Candidatus Micrarchaeota archaeon]|nr:metallophosphoesterase family protein [Candidatus Micrarchaeota archaeon]